MEIGNLFGSNKETPTESFLAIQIQEDLIKTAVWQITDGLPKVLFYGPSLPWSDSDSLLTAVDNSLADALKDSSLEPDRVIFGLPETWIKDDKITTDYSPLLKNLIDKLELKAIGFVVITEAIIQHLRTTEGIPPTAIILELNLSRVSVAVVRLGKIIAREEVVRSDDLAKDVAEGLARMELDQLPSRFLIINGSDAEAEQQLVSYSWDELSFLHLPKVEVPDPHFSIEAVALSGGSEAAKSIGIDVSLPLPESTAPVGSDSALPAVKNEEINIDTDTHQEPGLEHHDFGFTLEEELPDDPNNDVDITEEIVPPPPPTSLAETAKPAPLPRKLPTLPKLPLRLPRSLPSLPSFSLPRLRFAALPLALALLVLTPALTFTGYLLFGKAEIKIQVTPGNLENTFTVALAESDHQSLPTLKATTDKLSMEQQAEISTTGEAIVGDKASGEITILNKTDTGRKLAKGTVLTTASNLKFVLDEEASISGKIARNDGSGDDYGKLTLPATAVSIGPDSNIEENTALTVSNFPASSLEGRATKAFSGGTAKTVRAVSKDDHQRLLTDLTQKLKDEAATRLNGAGTEQQVIALSNLDNVEQSFSKDIGEEADSVSLTLKAEVPLLKYNRSQLHQLILDQVGSTVPAGFSFDPQLSKIEISDPTADEAGVVTATAKVTAQLLPAVNTADYLTRLHGKPLATAKQLLETIPGFAKVTFLINPPLPILSKRLPFNTNRLSLTIEPSF